MIKVNLGGRGGKGMSVPRTAKQKQASVRNLIKARARRKNTPNMGAKSKQGAIAARSADHQAWLKSKNLAGGGKGMNKRFTAPKPKKGSKGFSTMKGKKGYEHFVGPGGKISF